MNKTDCPWKVNSKEHFESKNRVSSGVNSDFLFWHKATWMTIKLLLGQKLLEILDKVEHQQKNIAALVRKENPEVPGTKRKCKDRVTALSWLLWRWEEAEKELYRTYKLILRLKLEFSKLTKIWECLAPPRGWKLRCCCCCC